MTNPRAHRIRRTTQLLFSAALSLALCDPACDDGRSPDLTCDDLGVYVPTGECTEFRNPCADRGPDGSRRGDWLRLDGFRVCGLPSGVTVATRRQDGVTRRFICASAQAGIVVNEAFDVTYSTVLGGASFGTSQLVLTVSPRVEINVTATPATINVGETAQLVANVAGGVPGHRSYSWHPTGGLNDSGIATPLASPTVTTTYDVSVTDAAGQNSHATVTVNVNAGIRVTVSPTVIVPGQSAQLVADALGGLPPYTFSWVPTEFLDDPTIANPVATPRVSTVYTATMTDSAGATRTGSVQLVVGPLLSVSPTASPATIDVGQFSQLDANPTGGSPFVSYSWSPAVGLSDPGIWNPTASPTTTTTYQLVARDTLAGTEAVGEITVTVDGASPAPTASFTFQDTCCPPAVRLDAGASTGNIVSYTWDLDWTAASPDAVTASPTTTFPVDEGSFGTITLTVAAADGRTATLSRTYP